MDMWTQERKLLAQRIARLDIIRRYAGRFGGERNPDGTAMVRNTEPWHAIAEKISAALWVLYYGPGEHMPGDPFNDSLSEEASLSSYTLASVILQSVPFLWSVEMEEIAVAAPMPPHILDASILPYDNMFFSRESCYRSTFIFEGGAESSDPFEHNWQLVRRSDSSITVFGDAVNTRTTVASVGVMDNFTIGQEITEDNNHTIRMLSFLNSPYTETINHYAPRHIRRRAQGDDERNILESPVSTIILRQPIRKNYDSEHKGAGKEWHHKWWTRAYHRNTWYPSRNMHQLQWIPAHLKGPLDKPLLQHVYKVKR